MTILVATAEQPRAGPRGNAQSFCSCRARSALCVPGREAVVVPVDGSHWLSLVGSPPAPAAEGHDIVVLAPDASVYIKEEAFYTLKQVPCAIPKEDLKRLYQPRICF